MWGTASSSNEEMLQRRQFKLLKIITGAPRYMRNSDTHSSRGNKNSKCQLLL